MKNNKWSADSFEKQVTSMSSQLSTDRNMNVLYIKLNTDYICLGHPPSNAWSLQEDIARFAANQDHILL